MTASEKRTVFGSQARSKIAAILVLQGDEH
jgi:hypothetical protein